MAQAPALIPGFQYRVNQGLFEDEFVTIVDNTPFPDGDPEGRQRKVTTTLDGEEFLILPRMLDHLPVVRVLTAIEREVIEFALAYARPEYSDQGKAILDGLLASISTLTL